MHLPSRKKEDEARALRQELEQLGEGLQAWREHVAVREEIAFYASRVEEFARRLALLEKRIALERNGEPVPVRVVQDTPPQAIAPQDPSDSQNRLAA